MVPVLYPRVRGREGFYPVRPFLRAMASNEELAEMRNVTSVLKEIRTLVLILVVLNLAVLVATLV